MRQPVYLCMSYCTHLCRHRNLCLQIPLRSCDIPDLPHVLVTVPICPQMKHNKEEKAMQRLEEIDPQAAVRKRREKMEKDRFVLRIGDWMNQRNEKQSILDHEKLQSETR